MVEFTLAGLTKSGEVFWIHRSITSYRNVNKLIIQTLSDIAFTCTISPQTLPETFSTKDIKDGIIHIIRYPSKDTLFNTQTASTLIPELSVATFNINHGKLINNIFIPVNITASPTVNAELIFSARKIEKKIILSCPTISIDA